MPEGDTIYRAARTLNKALAGKVVTAFETGLAKLASLNDDAPVAGRVVEKVESRGKWCLIYFSGDLILATHMLMSGSWHIYRTGEKWQMPHGAMRVVVRVASAAGPTHAVKPHEWATRSSRDGEGFEAVAFNVPVAEFHTARSLERSTQIPKLGPDILASDFSSEAGVRALREHAASHLEVEVGVALLNQRVLAGLGNVYKSEVAFAAGVHPFRAMQTLTMREIEKLVEFAQRYLKANVAEGTSEEMVTYIGMRRTTGAMHRGDRLWVYARRGQECRRCGAAIEMRKQGTAARVTFWCPSCQPWVETSS